MTTETIARRYAVALADSVLASGQTETVRPELAAISGSFAQSEELNMVFGNPSIAHSDKENVLNSLITKIQPSKTTGNFLKILLQNGRIGDIAAINERFTSVLEERSGSIKANVTSARELPGDERGDFEKNLEKLTGKKVSVDYSVDETIIGGVIARIGSTVYDSSVKTKLENLKEKMVNG